MGVKISGLTAKGATIADTDLVEVSQSAGGGLYTTRSVTGANIKALVTDANMTTSDITTNDVSTAKHGFAPKAPNDTAKFLRGDGTWATVPAGGLTNFTEAANSSAPNATVPVNSLTATGAATNIDAAIRPKGTGAFILSVPDNTATGGNKRGAGAVDLQMFRQFNYQVASGPNSCILGGIYNTASATQSTIGGGYQNSATGNYSGVLSGLGNTASGQASAVVAGEGNTASGPRSGVLGTASIASGDGAYCVGANLTASGVVSLALGFQASTLGIFGRQVYASGQEATAGDSQASKFILRERTTGNTPTTITSDSGAAGTTNQVILSNQSAYRFKGSIVGKQSGSVNAAVWDIDGFIVRGANAAATTLNISNVTLVQNTPAWGTPTLAADTTNGGLRVQVTGAAATNIQWTAVIETTEVIYA